MLGKSQIAGVDLPGLLALVVIVVVVLLPVLLSRGGAPPDQSPPQSDGGGGSGPRRPPGSPAAPRGGIPLEDAETARIRVRDHTGRLDWARRASRRQTREPAPEPVNT